MSNTQPPKPNASMFKKRLPQAVRSTASPVSKPPVAARSGNSNPAREVPSVKRDKSNKRPTTFRDAVLQIFNGSLTALGGYIIIFEPDPEAKNLIDVHRKLIRQLREKPALAKEILDIAISREAVIDLEVTHDSREAEKKATFEAKIRGKQCKADGVAPQTKTADQLAIVGIFAEALDVRLEKTELIIESKPQRVLPEGVFRESLRPIGKLKDAVADGRVNTGEAQKSGPLHQPSFEVEVTLERDGVDPIAATGSGSSIKRATDAAAQKILDALGINSDPGLTL